jgi:hypothetical protein
MAYQYGALKAGKNAANVAAFNEIAIYQQTKLMWR